MSGVIADTFNGYTLAVALVALVGLVVTLAFGASIRGRIGRVEIATEQVSRQVNHVEDPDNEPTLRDHVTDTAHRLAAVEASVAASSEHGAATRRLTLRTIDDVAVVKSDLAHISHQIADLATLLAASGRIDRRKK